MEEPPELPVEELALDDEPDVEEDLAGEDPPFPPDELTLDEALDAEPEAFSDVGSSEENTATDPVLLEKEEPPLFPADEVAALLPAPPLHPASKTGMMPRQSSWTRKRRVLFIINPPQ